MLRKIAIRLFAILGAVAASSVAQSGDVKSARPFQPGDYVGGGHVARPAKPYQAGDFVGGGGVALAARPYEQGDEGGGFGIETTGSGGAFEKPAKHLRKRF